MAQFLFLLSIFIMWGVGGAEVDIFIPGFPQIKSQFNLTTFEVELLLSLNFIACCIGCILFGAISDQYGRKPIIIFGCAVFTIGSALCIISPNFYLLLLGRILQGFGIAAPSTIAFLIVADNFSLKKTQSILGLLNGTATVAIATAPVIGSWVTLHYGWIGNFYILFASAFLCLFCSIFFLPKDKPHHAEDKPKLKDFALVFRSRVAISYILLIAFSCSSYWVFIGLAPILYMQDLHVPLEKFGYYQGALAFVFGTLSFLSGKIINTFGQNQCLRASLRLGVVCVAALTLAYICDIRNPLLITLIMSVNSMSAILPMTILYPIALNIVPKAKGKLSAIMQAARLIFTALGLQVASYFYNHNFKSMALTIIFFISLTLILLAIMLRDKRRYHLVLDKV